MSLGLAQDLSPWPGGIYNVWVRALFKWWQSNTTQSILGFFVDHSFTEKRLLWIALILFSWHRKLTSTDRRDATCVLWSGLWVIVGLHVHIYWEVLTMNILTNLAHLLLVEIFAAAPSYKYSEITPYKHGNWYFYIASQNPK